MLIKTNENNTVPPCYLSSYGASYSLTPSRSKKSKTVGQKSGCEVQNHTTRIKITLWELVLHYENRNHSTKNWHCSFMDSPLSTWGASFVEYCQKLARLMSSFFVNICIIEDHYFKSLLEAQSLLQWQQPILRNDFLEVNCKRWTHHIERLIYMCLLHHDFEAWIGGLDSSRRRRWARRKLSCWRTSLLPPPLPWRCWFGMHPRDSCVLMLQRSFTTWCSDLTCCSRGISSFGIAEEHCCLFTIITTVSAAFFSTFSYLFEIVHLSFPTTDLFAGADRAFLLEQIVQTMVVPFLQHPFLSNPCTANCEWPTRVNTSWSPLTKQW